MVAKIRTTHVGSLPRTPELLEANLKRGELPAAEFQGILEAAVADVVKRQLDLGLDIINEGEYGHITSGAVDYGAWWNYSFSRLGGLTMTDTDRWESAEVVRSKPGEPRLTSFIDRRDRALFSEAYNDPDSGIFTGRAKVANPEFTGPVTYIGQDEVAADVRLLADALPAGTPGFIAALSPGSAARLTNRYYDDEHELLADVGRAMRTEYQAITDAGLTVQFDAPDLAEAWDQINPEPTVEDFRGFIRERIDVLNDSIAGLPKEQTRLHICWGSWHGPHTTDIPFADIVDEVLKANVGTFVFEAGNVRHEHEWTVWRDVEVPAGLTLLPGVVSHATNVVEHPDLVAQRIGRFAEAVGSDRVIASSDCGFGGRVHPDIAWAKLDSLGEGARRA